MEETKFMISDAAKKVGLESHVLRYWEVELNLPIKRTELGHRYYTDEDIVVFKDIKNLKEQGLQLKAIRLLVVNGIIQNKVVKDKTFKIEDDKNSENSLSNSKSDILSERRNDNSKEEIRGKRDHKEDVDRTENEEIREKNEKNRREEENRYRIRKEGKCRAEEIYRNREEAEYENRKNNRNENRYDNFYDRGEEYLGSKIILNANEIIGRTRGDLGEDKFFRLQMLLKDMINEVIKENNKELCEEIKGSVLKEMDYQFRLQEEREEEHFKKVDELLRTKVKEKVKRKKHSFF